MRESIASDVPGCELRWYFRNFDLLQRPTRTLTIPNPANLRSSLLSASDETRCALYFPAAISEAAEESETAPRRVFLLSLSLSRSVASHLNSGLPLPRLGLPMCHQPADSPMFHITTTTAYLDSLTPHRPRVVYDVAQCFSVSVLRNPRVCFVSRKHRAP